MLKDTGGEAERRWLRMSSLMFGNWLDNGTPDGVQCQCQCQCQCQYWKKVWSKGEATQRRRGDVIPRGDIGSVSGAERGAMATYIENRSLNTLLTSDHISRRPCL